MTWGIPHVMRTTTSARAASAHPRRPARSRHWASSATHGDDPRADQGQNHCVEADQPLERPVSVERAYEFLSTVRDTAGKSRGHAALRKLRRVDEIVRREPEPFAHEGPLPRMRATYHENHRSMPPATSMASIASSAHCRNHPAKSPVTRRSGTGQHGGTTRAPKARHRHKGADGRTHATIPAAEAAAKAQSGTTITARLFAGESPAARPSARAAGQLYGRARKRAGEHDQSTEVRGTTPP